MKNTLHLPFVQDILSHSDFTKLKSFLHHGSTTCYSHSLEVAYLSYIIAKKCKCDYISATRGALLHDFYLYNWKTQSPGFHGFKHPRIALNNALQRFDLNDIEQDIILRHMWPLTPIPPRYLESWIVTCADKIISIKDYLHYLWISLYTVAITLFNTVKLCMAKIAKTIAPYTQSEQ